MNNYTEVGFFSKTHGFKGSLIITPTNNISVIWKELETVFYGKQGSGLLPAFIQEISNSGNKIFIKLENFDTKESASDLIGMKVFVDADFIEIDDNKVFPGYQVIDKNLGLIGLVKEIQQMPAQQILLVVDEKNNEILLPYVSNFVSSVNHEDKIINYCAPEGLIEIYRS